MLKNLITTIKSGLFRYQEADHGFIIKIAEVDQLVKAAEKMRDAGAKNFDCFSPFPIHGLDEAMGLKRSWIPFITLKGGLMGLASAMLMMIYIMVIDWPQNFGGKPAFSWPAFIPIAFELTILFSGLLTVAGVIYLGRLGNVNRKPVGENTTIDKFSIWVDDQFSESELQTIIGSYAQEIEKVSDNENN